MSKSTAFVLSVNAAPKPEEDDGKEKAEISKLIEVDRADGRIKFIAIRGDADAKAPHHKHDQKIKNKDGKLILEEDGKGVIVLEPKDKPDDRKGTKRQNLDAR